MKGILTLHSSNSSISPSKTPTTSPSSIPTSSPLGITTATLVINNEMNYLGKIFRQYFSFDGFLALGDAVCNGFVLGDGVLMNLPLWYMRRDKIAGYESHRFGYMRMIIQPAPPPALTVVIT